MTSQLDTIRSQNDQFRTNIPNVSEIPGRLLITQGVQDLADDEAEPNKYLPDIIKAVREFDDFNSDNDPNKEHDFGAFDFNGERIFWKIDYYAPDMVHGSEDPSDTSKTMRVLTIMLASEY